jgi:hypothetical protein
MFLTISGKGYCIFLKLAFIVICFLHKEKNIGSTADLKIEISFPRYFIFQPFHLVGIFCSGFRDGSSFLAWVELALCY